MRILIAEDDPSLLITIARQLRASMYSVDIARNGKEWLGFIEMFEYDCIIIDLTLSGFDGITALRELRQKKIETPVLILTIIDAIEDRVRALDNGADDYLLKPFSFKELLARVQTLLRRHVEEKETVLRIADLILDTKTRTALRGGKTIKLTLKEYMILEYLFTKKEMLVTRSQIIEQGWDGDYRCKSNVVDVYICYLRRKIDNGFERQLIHTIRGSGYMLTDNKNRHLQSR